ncbi:MAG: ribosome maturation factor RimM [Myxococcota bacterium]
MKPHLQFGYVSRAHGLDGEVVVRTFDPSSTVLEEIERVFVRTRGGEEREFRISGVREGPKGDLLVTFKGVRRREDAEPLTGSAVFAFREDLEAPGHDEVFQGDLVGLDAFTPDGVRLGKVEGLFDAGAAPNLVIREGEREWMVPLVDDFVKEIDLSAGRVVVTPIDLGEE